MLHSYRTALIMLMWIAAIFVVPRAFATTFYVSTTGANTNAGTESSPWRDIQYAITTSATASGDLIIVGNGTYTEHLVFSTKVVTVASMHYITGNAADIANTVIDGTNTGTAVTFSTDATLTGFTIRRGNTAGNGGGITISDCSPILSHLVVRNSRAANGGGIYMASGSPMLSNVTTVQNSASYGGGVYMASGSPMLSNVTTVQNSAAYGGGVYMETATPTITGVRADSNSASQYGGGLYIKESVPMLSNTTVQYNTASYGGGIAVTETDVHLFTLTVSHNKSTTEGGGISLYDASVGLSNSTVASNTSGFGGGIYVLNSHLYLDSTAVTSNSSTYNGGGICVDMGIIYATHATLSFNRTFSGLGGGAYINPSELEAEVPEFVGQTLPGFSYSDITNNRTLESDGGGLYITSSSGLVMPETASARFPDPITLYLDHTNILNNRAGQHGGGVYWEGNIAVLRSVVFDRDTAQTGLGGAMYMNGVMASLDSLAITSNIASDNGGGLYIEGSSVYASNLTAKYNRTMNGNGGGIYQEYALVLGGVRGMPSVGNMPPEFDSDLPTVYTNIVLDSNSARLSGGGAYFYELQLGVFNSTVSNNSVGTFGGGLYAEYSQLLLDNVTVESNRARFNGGGLYMDYTDLFATTATIRSNSSDGSGGGIYMEYPYSGGASLPSEEPLVAFANRNPGLTASVIDKNFANDSGGGMMIASVAPAIWATTISENSTGGNGGGMVIAGFSSDSLVTTVGDALFVDNQANSGGAVWMEGTDPHFYNVVIENNTAMQGGGIYASATNPVMDNILVHRNNATNGMGGGIVLIETSSSALLSNITVSDNSSSGIGGGMYVYDLQSTITNLTLKGNRGAGQGGGGMYIENSTMATFDNLLVSGNYSDITVSSGCRGGGGIYADACSLMVLKNATITGNYSEGDGGGILLASSDVNMINSIIWNNGTLSTDPDINRCTMAAARVYNSIVDPMSIDEGTGNFYCDPMFIAGIEFESAPTTSGNFHVQVYSPAIGAGVTSATIVGPNIVVVASGLDIEGTTRGTVPDMGTYESTLDMPVSTIVAMDDSAVQCSAEPVTIPIFDNDNVLLDGALVLESYTQGTGGSVTIADDERSLLYSAYPGFIGTDTFTYSVSSGTCSVSSIATVSVFVNPVISPVLSLDGNGSYVIADNIVTTQLDNITMEAWIRWDGKTGDANYIILNGNAGTDGYGLFYNYPELNVLCGGVGYATASISFKPEAWYHVAGVRDNGTWKLYLNGISLPVNGNPEPNPVTSTTFIGGDHEGSSTFDGAIDEVRIWNTARTEDEIQQNMLVKLVGNETGLASYYTFDEAIGSTTANAVTSGPDAVLVNDASWENAPIVVGADTAFSNGVAYTYRVMSMSGTTYSWTANNGTIVETTTNGVSIVWDNVYTGTVTVTAANALGCQASSSKDVRIFSDRSVYYVCSSGNDETGLGSEEAPFATIGLGIELAQDGDTVLLCPGIYYEPLVITKGIAVGSYYLTTGDTTYISQTVIDGQYYRGVVQFTESVPTTATLSGLTLQHGSTSTGGGLYLAMGAAPLLDHLVVKDNYADDGGGIYIDEMAAPVLRNVHITGNYADNNGAGIYSYQAFPLLSNVTVMENTSYYDGGGIYVEMPEELILVQPAAGAEPVDNNMLIIENTSFRNNAARFGAGGGLYLYTNSCGRTSEGEFPERYAITITNAVVDSNSSMYGGGGIAMSNVSPMLSNVTITNNTTNGSGGGIYIEGSSAPVLSVVTVNENSSNDGGGGLYIDLDGYLTWNGGELSKNKTPGEGGGLLSDGALLSLTGLTVAENSSGSTGGGLDIYTQSLFSEPIEGENFPNGGVEIDSCIIVRNMSSIGGGIAINGIGRGTIPLAMPATANSTIPWFMSIDHSRIDSNSASFAGGGVFLLGVPITVWSSSISDNQSFAFGGGIANIGSLTWFSKLTVTGNTSSVGGGAYLTQSQILFDSSAIRNNIANEVGGGLYIGEAAAELYSLTVDSNMATGDGGGIYMENGSVVVDATSIHTNTAEGNGGGMAIYSMAPQLSNLTVSGNTAGGNGGGIYKYSTSESEESSEGVLPDNVQLIENTVISGNYASGSGGCSGGGGMMIESASTATILVGVTITGNNVPDGSGGGLLLSDANAEIVNSIVWNNSASIDNNIAQCSTAHVNAYYSVVPAADVDSAYATVECDPLFIAAVNPLAAPTTSGNLHVQDGSPTIGMAVNSLELGIGTVPMVSYDIEGTTRGNPQDIGAYENVLDIPTSVVVAMNDSVTTCIDIPVNIALLLNDTSSKAITIVAVTQGTGGTVTLGDATTATYTPNTGFWGLDSFTYIVNTGDCDRPDTAMVTVNVGNRPYLVVSGTSAVCSFASETYSVADTNNTGASYQWTIEAPGATTAPVFVGSSTGTSVVIQFGEFTSQTLCSLSVAALAPYECTNSVIFTVQGYSQPVANAGSGVEACTGDTRTLGSFVVDEETSNSGMGGSGIFSYIWTPDTGLSDVNVPNPEVTVSTTTTYTLTVTDLVTGCTATDEVTVTAYPLPAVAIDKTTGCGGLISTYTVTDTNNTGANFSWDTESLECGSVISESGNTISILWSSVSETTVCSFGVRASTSQECLTQYTFSITINPAPVPVLSGVDDVCSSSMHTYTVLDSNNTSAAYQWSVSRGTIVGASTGATISVLWSTVGESTVGEVEVMLATDEGCVVSQSLNVAIHPNPVATIIGVDSVYAGTVTMYSVTGATQSLLYNWSVTGGTITSNSTDNYILVHWSTGNSIITTGAVHLTATNQNGCSVMAQFDVTIHPAIPIDIAGDSIITGNTTGMYGVSGVDTTTSFFQWTTPSGGRIIGSSTNATVRIEWDDIEEPTTATLSVSVRTEGGGTGSTTFTVQIYPRPILVVTGDVTVCSDGIETYTVTDTRNTGSSYEWGISGGTIIGTSTGSTVSVQWNATSATTTASILVTGYEPHGFDGVTSANVTVYPNPSISISGMVAVCGGTIATYEVSDAHSTGAAYNWTVTGGTIISGQETASIQVQWDTQEIPTVGNIAVIATGAGSCFDMKNVAVTVYPVPSLHIAGTADICEGSIATYAVSDSRTTGITSFAWSIDGGSIVSGQNSNEVTVQWTSVGTGTVSVMGESADRCSASTSHTVIVNEQPFPTIAGNTEVCADSTTVLDAGVGYASYLWSTGEKTRTITVATSGEYTVTVTSEAGCTATTSANVMYLPQVVANAGNDVAICAGESLQLNGIGTSYIGAMEFRWTPTTGLSDPNIADPIVTPTTTTTYTLTVTDGYGCSISDQITITVKPLPQGEVSSDVAICNGGTAQLVASGGASYVWTPVTGLNDPTVANPMASPVTTTTYTVLITGANGCSVTRNVTVNVNNLPFANAGTNVEICAGAATQLQATGGVSYSWSPATGLNNPTVANPIATPTETTVYTVTVSNQSGCLSTSQVTVTVKPIMLNAVVLLEGPYGGSSHMNTFLQDQGLLPAQQPYGNAPFNYSGNETMGAVPSGTIVDWVLVELRSQTAASSVVTRRAALLRSDGHIVDTDGVSPVALPALSVNNGGLYIAVWHRNHLAIMSAMRIEPAGNCTLSYNFTGSQFAAYTQFDAPQKQLGVAGAPFGMIAADANSDGVINAIDRVLINNATGSLGYLFPDASLDGIVNAVDRVMVRNNVFRATQLP